MYYLFIPLSFPSDSWFFRDTYYDLSISVPWYLGGILEQDTKMSFNFTILFITSFGLYTSILFQLLNTYACQTFFSFV